MCPIIPKWILVVFALVFLSAPRNMALPINGEQHTFVALRMIGHQMLLNFGDSTSRVLPIEKVDGRYKIQFDTDFRFMPDSLVSIISNVILETDLSNGYIVEVQNCGTDEIVYSFEMDNLYGENLIPCKGRGHPKACYNLLLTLIDPINRIATDIGNSTEDIEEAEPEAKERNYPLMALPLVLVLAAFFFLRKKKIDSKPDSNLLQIGNFQFDKLKSELIFEEIHTELTGKEADLLIRLFENVNQTIERDTLLNKVWGDEGDYVGRTLDVFISKLRKKLEADPNVKIANIRGVGYKMVIGL